MNPLEQYPQIRAYLYLIQWVANGILGAIGVALVLLGLSPLWFVLTTAVLNWLWAYAGITAQSNTPTEES